MRTVQTGDSKTLSHWLQDQNLEQSAFAGNIGLWWVDRLQFYIHLHEVDDGVDFDGNMHSVMNHQKAWKSTVLSHRPDLRPYSYTYLPRGRIYYNKASLGFVTVGTPGLIELPRFVAALAEQFDIKNLTVSSGADDHYTGDMGPDIGTLLKTIEVWKPSAT